MSAESSFFVTGGTVPTDSSSYVERKADKDLLSALQNGDYCFVLNSRQMGKSSLSVRTIAKLNAAGIQTAFVDLTKIGAQNVTAEQWYAGLLAETGRGLSLRKEFVAYWKEHVQLPPVQRYFGALREVALATLDSRIVVFVDEIDAVRSLSFAADEFFAAVRACYNSRTEDDTYKRITFCLVGAATPADLISDTRMSPFNIGRRIELRDFTEPETQPLASHLPGGKATLDRVLHWTGGQPYLTQRLCRAVVEEPNTPVDKLCDALFLSKSAQESDDNISFVRNRLLKSEVDLASLLDLYGKVRSGKQIRDDETNPLCGVLRLSGACRLEGDYLKVRNRIYDHVFDKHWVLSHMPDAELRRQRAAATKGRWQVGSIAAVVLIGMGGLTTLAIRNAAQAARSATHAQLYLYYASMKNAQLAYQSGAFEQLDKLLNDTKDSPARGWEWGYWKRLAHQEEAILTTYPSRANVAAISPNGKYVLSADDEGHFRLHNAQTHQLIYDRQLPEIMKLPVLSFSPDSRRFAISGSDVDWGKPGIAEIRDTATGEVISGIQHLVGHKGGINWIQFSPDGKRIVTGGLADGVKLWQADTGKEIKLSYPIQFGMRLACPFFSPDGKHLAVTFIIGDQCHTALFDAESGKEKWRNSKTNSRMTRFTIDGKWLVTGNVEQKTTILNARNGTLVSTLDQENASFICLSKDGSQIATGDYDGTINVLKHTLHKSLTLPGHSGIITSLAFFPDGKHLLSSSEDFTVRIWDTTEDRSHMQISAMKGISTAIFSPNGNDLLLACSSGWVKIRHLKTKEEITFQTNQGFLRGARYNQDGSRFVTCGGKTAVIWDTQTHQKLQTLKHEDLVSNVAFSPDGTRLLTTTTKEFEAGYPGKIVLWDLRAEKAASIPLKLSPVGCAFFPDGTRFVTGSGDSVVKVYDTNTLKLLMSLKGHRYCINAVAVSPNGIQIATAAEDNSAILWDARTGRRLFTLLGHRKKLLGLAFSPDGKRLATCSADKTVKIWDTSTGEETLTLSGGKTEIGSVNFSPDGHQIVAGEFLFEGSEKRKFDALIWTSDDTNAKAKTP